MDPNGPMSLNKARVTMAADSKSLFETVLQVDRLISAQWLNELLDSTKQTWYPNIAKEVGKCKSGGCQTTCDVNKTLGFVIVQSWYLST